MTPAGFLLSTCALLPAALMLAAMPHRRGTAVPAWGRFRALTLAGFAATLASLALQLAAAPALAVLPPGLGASLTGAWVAVLVQLLGTVIGVFSSRYLQGEPDQPRYVSAFSGVLATVHLLLLADHWLVLIAAWAAVNIALQHLLCFYTDRPFALLAAHKKRLADRLADLLLIAAAALAWNEVGSGSLPALWRHLETGGSSAALQASAVCLALAVVLRTALLPVHGWLIQVMEAPTPVSALLHAGVVNLGGFVLIRFAPLLEAAPVARWLLVGIGLATALLAGLVMLTRVSIKVRLAWSTVAQMGFMVMECGLGLYTLALLHLIGSAQMNVIEFHTWNATTRAPAKPDRMVFDLDPGEGVGWAQIAEGAELAHAFLDELGLVSFLKTSGGKGLHLVVPIVPKEGWDEVKAVSKRVVEHLAKVLPDRFVAKSGPKNRVGRIFIDYLRNGFGSTTVCAWSMRARPGLGISVPCDWSELKRLSGGDHWTLSNVHERIEERADPWSAYVGTRQTLVKASKALG